MTERGGVGWDRELKERWPSGWCDMAGCELRCCTSKIRTTGDASAPLRNPQSHKATRPKDHFPHSCTAGGPTLTPKLRSQPAAIRCPISVAHPATLEREGVQHCKSDLRLDKPIRRTQEPVAQLRTAGWKRHSTSSLTPRNSPGIGASWRARSRTSARRRSRRSKPCSSPPARASCSL
jgi:hypothetical protein